ncbi:MAG: TolB protein [Myxococcales bacterium]|nr:TolB protein [Myxococcales bacterium]
MQVSRFRFFFFVPVACLALATLRHDAGAQQPPPPAPVPAPTASALPAAANNGAVTSVVVSGGARALFKIAVAPPPGDAAVAGTVVDTASRDFTLSSMFQVLDPKSFTANLEREGLAIDPASWRTVGAEGVVKGNTSMRGSNVHLELRLYVVSRGSDAVLKKDYDVAPGAVRGAVHQFDNEVVKYFTGTAASFGSRLVFSATTGRGQKGIFGVDSDGQGLGRMQAVSNVALAPAVGPGGSVYYAGGLADGSYQLFKYPGNAQVMKQTGLVFGVAFGGGAGKMAVVVSQNGQSDIWTGAPDGANLTKVTQGGLNTHPAFGPGGQLAYVSNAGGNPQIYVDGKRVSFRGTYNMAPVWCNDPDGVKILFMGRDGGTWDIFSIDPSGGNMKRLTQDQGSNTYPACSPDGRTVAFFSTRGGLYLSNPQGQNQQKIASVTGESLRWEGN